MICIHLYLIWNIGPNFFSIFLLLDWWGLVISYLGHLCHLASGPLELTHVSLFQNICNFTQLGLYGVHHDPFTRWKFFILLIILKGSFINSLPQYRQHSVSLVKKTKLHFASTNAPLSRCRKFSFLFFHYPKRSNPLINTILPPCMDHCP
jgi:hypothetical protein